MSKEKEINPISYFNETGGQYMLDLMMRKPLGNYTSPDSFSYTKSAKLKKQRMIEYKDGLFKAVAPNDLGMPMGELYTPYRMLVEFEFKNNWIMAAYHIIYNVMNKKIPYIRVGTKYFKSIEKVDRNGIHRIELKVWDRLTLLEDHGKDILIEIPTYDDFTIVPDNKSFNQIRGNNYNLYSPFAHVPALSYREDQIPWTTTLLKHIFGEQYELGLIYLKVLYDLPTQKLPILVLTSDERSTGKTTFIDYLELLFGANAVIINPQDISSGFNGTYAASNIIMIEESRFESVQATEKLKNLATQKKIMVNTKFVQQYSIPFHGKLIITSNDENKFSRIDSSEIRYWVRKVPTLEGKANHAILSDLKKEIPAFLCKLNKMEKVDTSKSRMVFQVSGIHTEALARVKKESMSWLYKDLQLLIDGHCSEHESVEYVKFISKDFKDAWFKNNSKVEISYIEQVIKHEMKLQKDKMQRYIPMEETHNFKKAKSGRPYVIKNKYYDPNNQKGTFEAEGEL